MTQLTFLALVLLPLAALGVLLLGCVVVGAYSGWKEQRSVMRAERPEPMSKAKTVVKVSFEVQFAEGGKRVAEFFRREKIDDLMTDEGSLGEFLRDLVSAASTKEK